MPNTSNVLSGVDSPSHVYTEMTARWELVETLRGGTDAIRLKKQKYLPQEPKESLDAYNNRLRRSFLYNLYWKTITAVVGLAYMKNVVVNGVPKELEYLEWDFDGNGRSLTQVAYDVTLDAIHYGLSYGIMDFPDVDTESMSLQDWRDAGFKPYFSVVNPTNLIGFRQSSLPNSQYLENVRIKENKWVAGDNDWDEKEVSYVRVMYPQGTDIYEYDPTSREANYVFKSSTDSSLGYIPLLVAYSNKEDFMKASPALYDLAQLNLCHYQSSSDQRNILHIARVPFLFAKGFQEDELTNGSVGGNTMIVSSNPNADIKHVEHTGQAISAGRADILDLESQMAVLGADFLLGKGVSRQTATARRIDQAESMSVLQLALRSVEQMIENAYQIAGQWLNVDASNVSIAIGDDLSQANEPNPSNALVALLDSGLFTTEQIFEIGQHKGIIPTHMKLDPNIPLKQQLAAIERDVQTTVIPASEENQIVEEVLEEKSLSKDSHTN